MPASLRPPLLTMISELHEHGFRLQQLPALRSWYIRLPFLPHSTMALEASWQSRPFMLALRLICLFPHCPHDKAMPTDTAERLGK